MAAGEPMSLSEIAAWWGAIIATLLLMWDVYKWRRSGARIHVRVGTDFLLVGSKSGSALEGEQTFACITVVNEGDLPATINMACGAYFPTLLHRWIRRIRGSTHFLVTLDQDLGSRVPQVVGPGEQWTGVFPQDSLKEKYCGMRGTLYLGVMHTASRTPTMARTNFSKSTEASSQEEEHRE